MVTEFLEQDQGLYRARRLFALPEFFTGKEYLEERVQCIRINEHELGKISSLSTPNSAVLEIGIPDEKPDLQSLQDKLTIYLENIRDPGNFGTIIRTADWFGMRTLVCSPGSVDLFNPKVLQASMGSFVRVRIIYMDPEELIAITSNFKPFSYTATIMEGMNVFEYELPDRGLIFFGNESGGLSDSIISKCDHRITIPGFNNPPGPDSLNLSIAAGIIMAEMKRKSLTRSGN